MFASSSFQSRHIGPNERELETMLQSIGVDSLDALITETVPSSIRLRQPLSVGAGLSEHDYLMQLKEISMKNKVATNFIGMGYYGTIVPGVIQRNIFENPGWYTQYTPYQAEISQGRLEALLNFQTMISDLTGLPVSNASLLDEATAASEAMLMLFQQKNKKSKTNEFNKIFVAKDVFPQTVEVLRNKANTYHIDIVIDDIENFVPDNTYFAILVQYPGMLGKIHDLSGIIEQAKAADIYVVMAADILSLALLTPPGELGADVAIGNTQRFGVPMGFGGPHAAYFACKEEFIRQIPGRLIGVSVDKNGNKALRMALQTREQHIKRDKATSNICTAQALLAIMASMYAVYHGPKGIRDIATNVHFKTVQLASELKKLGYQQLNQYFFDTLHVQTTPEEAHQIQFLCEVAEINLHYLTDGTISISIDETTGKEDLDKLVKVLAQAKGIVDYTTTLLEDPAYQLPDTLKRNAPFLAHPVFNTYHSETEMLRYLKRLENKDLSLTLSMIPLGSCTMKLNASTEMIPLSWSHFSSIHPFAPEEQTLGYRQIIEELENDLCQITGFDACSLQPNSGAQGEYAGLMVIRAYHHDRGDKHRNIALIPASAHGTNPASAAIAGMNIVVVACDEMGNINVEDLKEKAAQYKENLSCLMVTYPSTHGVFEESIIEICEIIHQYGGKVYMDGANMNAQVGLTSPANIGADVCHLNLHKTFAIPHGGGGPGMGPICVKEDLAPYLPGNPIVKTGGAKAIPAISAAPWGSASILLISYAYIKLLGSEGLTNATRYAILNANYLKSKLEKDYSILYTGHNDRVAHEFIVDIRPLKALSGIDAVDIAKRLMDYGFHAPTVSFPVAGTLMIEPTESEGIKELDRLAEAMLSIRREIQEVMDGKYPPDNNPVMQAPHTANELCIGEWNHPYSREEAAFPVNYLQQWKFWPSVAKIDNTYGDRNLVCTCPPIEDYM
ncbi:MAG: aminomethyl-transferring glycine dehydrogenase [Chitinophagales bacterium]|nr:aminomethyl-transferring glycine dehydrogenase [Chitinophagales bacterium]